MHKYFIITKYLSFFLILSSAYAADLPDYSIDYDPDRKPSLDLAAAIDNAQKNNRLVLMIVGGYWCHWCYVLDDFLEKEEEYYNRFYATFEVVKVYYGDENRNQKFLSKYPRIRGYPHFFILDNNYNLVGSQDTGKLEMKLSAARDRYSTGQMERFLKKWELYLKDHLTNQRSSH